MSLYKIILVSFFVYIPQDKNCVYLFSFFLFSLLHLADVLDKAIVRDLAELVQVTRQSTAHVS